ncbi:hypothetical protein ACIBQ1_14130 [Nonomuraea sp. NPDC050153]|uniref:hypothetical protein n=1 Tax=Nonomuraea sp. NPDC050153 TaxID=3364359 RepID=UPI0037B8AB8D
MDIHVINRMGAALVTVGVGGRGTRRQGTEDHVLRGRVWRLAALFVGAVSFIAGCGANDPAAYQMTTATHQVALATYQVPPAALDEVRSIGLVQAESSVEVDMDDSGEFANTFVIDLGSASANAATGKAASLLRERGWEIIGKERPWFIMMKSTKWNTFLAIDSFQSVHLASHPDILKTLKNTSAKTEASVIINVEVYQGG